MPYGIQAYRDVRLSNISRILKEQESLIKTEDRLSRDLDDEDFTDGINEEIMRMGPGLDMGHPLLSLLDRPPKGSVFS